MSSWTIYQIKFHICHIHRPNLIGDSHELVSTFLRQINIRHWIEFRTWTKTIWMRQPTLKVNTSDNNIGQVHWYVKVSKFTFQPLAAILLNRQMILPPKDLYATFFPHTPPVFWFEWHKNWRANRASCIILLNQILPSYLRPDWKKTSLRHHLVQDLDGSPRVRFRIYPNLLYN